jgi:ribosomal-protein-alanine N-acetyltransferase
MPLPILQAASDPSSRDLVRYFLRTELHWTQHIAEATELDVGTAFTNPDLPKVRDANCVHDARLPDGMAPEGAVETIDAHFKSRGIECAYWRMNPAATVEQQAPLVAHLKSRGFVPRATDIMRLQHMPREPVIEVADLKIIPARASYRHAQTLAEEASRRWNEPQLVDAAMLHLDDPHWDAMIALKDGRAVAKVGVLAVGDMGRIEDLFVSEQFRGQGNGRTMMSRALEICARSLFKHVFLSVAPDNARAIELYQRLGFEKIGGIEEYHRA